MKINTKNILILVILFASAVILWYLFTTKYLSMKLKKSDLIVINVLDKNLYDDCHIKGSINVPFGEIKEYASKIDKSTPVVVYCSNYQCTASGAAAKMLQDMGFENVW